MKHDPTSGAGSARSIRKAMVTAVAAVVILGITSLGSAIEWACIKIVGQTQGPITGMEQSDICEVDFAEVMEYSHNLSVPTDDNGLPTGSVKHSPLQIVKLISKSSPLLLAAIDNGEPLQITLNLYRDGGAQPQLAFVISLLNATVVNIRPWKPFTSDDPEHPRYPGYEAVSFLYQSCTYTWPDGGITYTINTQPPPPR